MDRGLQVVRGGLIPKRVAHMMSAPHVTFGDRRFTFAVLILDSGISYASHHEKQSPVSHRNKSVHLGQSEQVIMSTESVLILKHQLSGPVLL